MHRLLRKALSDAEGQSQFVIVVVADIRGFSEFSSRRESPDIAMYIRRVYMRLIDDYFRNACFFKPTGDGLLVIIPYKENTFAAVAEASITSCLRCVEEFPSICEGYAMVNFEVPGAIGIGVARGTACCLRSSNRILDYSGHILNLATRLCDLARPSGVVVDGTFGLALLSEECQNHFEEASIYIRSISEEIPRQARVQKDRVQIPDHAKRPLKFEIWQTEEKEMPLERWRDFRPYFLQDLPHKLKRPDGLMVSVVHTLVRGGKVVEGVEHRWGLPTDAFEYRLLAGHPGVRINIDEMLKTLRAKKVRRDMNVKITISYVPG